MIAAILKFYYRIRHLIATNRNIERVAHICMTLSINTNFMYIYLQVFGDIRGPHRVALSQRRLPFPGWFLRHDSGKLY